MIKRIKKANSKWILLFWLGLFSVGVQGQHNENGQGNFPNYAEGYDDDFVNISDKGGTYVNGINEHGVQRTVIASVVVSRHLDSAGDLVIVYKLEYSYAYVKRQDATGPYNPYALGTGTPPYVGSGGSSYSPVLNGQKPLTDRQFDAYCNGLADGWITTSKNNQTITTSDGKTHTGVLFKFQMDLKPNPHVFYYFKPNSSQTLNTQLYYFYPDRIGDKATTNNFGTTTIANVGINFTYDSTGFPIGQGYYLNTSGIAISAFISSNFSKANLDSFKLPNTKFYNQEFEIDGIGGKIFYKTENNIPKFAPIYEQLMFNSYGGLALHSLLNYYKTRVNINSSITSNSNIIHMELKSYLAGNGSLSPVSQEFIDWLVSVTAIQIGAVNTNFEILEAPDFSSAFGEDDDILKLNSTDPFFTNKTDDPWRLKNLLSPDDSYVVGFLAGLGDGCIETADLAYSLVKFGIKNSPGVLMIRLLTDTENTIKEKIEEVKVVRDLVSLVYDKPRQDLIFNTIKAEVADWFDAATFQKTNVQAGYAQGKIVFEIVGALLGIAEVKALLKTGQFTASALNAINKIDGIIKKGFKFVKRDGVTSLVDDTGEVLATGINATKELAEKIVKWTNADGTVKWPLNNGFDGVPNNTNLPVGLKIDRYGDPTGRFTSPKGTSFSERALKPGTTRQLSSYQVIQPIPAKSGKVLPWFDEIGGGTQYEFDNTIQWLLDNDYLIKI